MNEQGFIARRTEALVLRKKFITKAIRRDWWIAVAFGVAIFAAGTASLIWISPHFEHHEVTGHINPWGVLALISFFATFAGLEWVLESLREKRERAEIKFMDTHPDIAKLL